MTSTPRRLFKNPLIGDEEMIPIGDSLIPGAGRAAEQAGSRWGGRVWNTMTDAVCCIFSPLKTICFTIFMILLIAVVIAVLILVLVKNSSTMGNEMVTTLQNQLISSAGDTLANIINGATDSDLAIAAYRRHFNTMAAGVFQIEHMPSVQGWLDSRPARISFSLLFANMDESSLGPLVLAWYTAVEQTWTTVPLVTTGPSSLPLANHTWQQTLTCPTPWAACQKSHASFLSGDRIYLLVLQYGTAPDQLPIPDSSTLFKIGL